MRNIVIIPLSLCWCGILLWAGITSDLVTISPDYQIFTDAYRLLFRHLRYSVIPFALLIIIFQILILKMRLKMDSPDARISEITFLDRLLNVVISAFFGVGIIWTAIGMETALMNSLEGMLDMDTANPGISAMGLLDRLVNGGLLFALSTTVFGGACGYLLKIFKIIYIGKQWDQLLIERDA